MSVVSRSDSVDIDIDRIDIDDLKYYLRILNRSSMTIETDDTIVGIHTYNGKTPSDTQSRILQNKCKNKERRVKMRNRLRTKLFTKQSE